MTTTKNAKVFCNHPDPDKAGTNVDKGRYDAMKRALLRHIPRHRAGVPFQGLAAAVRSTLPEAVFANASVGWHVTTVKLDLEARGLIERVPDVRPQHLRRVK